MYHVIRESCYISWLMNEFWTDTPAIDSFMTLTDGTRTTMANSLGSRDFRDYEGYIGPSSQVVCPSANSGRG